MKKSLILALGLLAGAPAIAQHGHHDAGSSSAAHGQAPYRGMQQRDIKSLSEQQITDLRAGKGMSLALPAELNGYPGPAHVLELAASLNLSEEQKHKTQALFEQMQVEAKALGERVIASERALNRLFKENKAELSSLREAALVAARAQGELRLAHLKYHLLMAELLDPGQIAKYNMQRGYR